MRGHREERIEAAADQVAASAFAAAVAFAIFHLVGFGLVATEKGVAAASSGVIGYALALLSLRRIARDEPMFGIPPFQVMPLDVAVVDELLLTEADIVQPRPLVQANELVLDDILAQLGPDSRVVRLFDPAVMPTPGQLNARIERHLRESPSQAPPVDASQALYEALSELRRSLR